MSLSAGYRMGGGNNLNEHFRIQDYHNLSDILTHLAG